MTGAKVYPATTARITQLTTELAHRRKELSELERVGSQRTTNDDTQALLLDLRHKISELENIVYHLSERYPAMDTKTVQIGLEVTFAVAGVSKTYIIGGYGDADSTTVPCTITCDIAAVWAIMDKPVGYRTTIARDGKRVPVEVQKIAFHKPKLAEQAA